MQSLSQFVMVEAEPDVLINGFAMGLLWGVCIGVILCVIIVLKVLELRQEDKIYIDRTKKPD